MKGVCLLFLRCFCFFFFVLLRLTVKKNSHHRNYQTIYLLYYSTYRFNDGKVSVFKSTIRFCNGRSKINNELNCTISWKSIGKVFNKLFRIYRIIIFKECMKTIMHFLFHCLSHYFTLFVTTNKLIRWYFKHFFY